MATTTPDYSDHPNGYCVWTYTAGTGGSPGYWTVASHCKTGKSCSQGKSPGRTPPPPKPDHPTFVAEVRAEFARTNTTPSPSQEQALQSPTNGDRFPMPCV